jgi:hypothetical protein
MFFCIVLFLFVRILARTTGVNSACSKKSGCFIKIYLCFTVFGLIFMRNYSNLDCRVHDYVCQYVPLTFDKYIFCGSLRTNQAEIIDDLSFYTIKNDVIYGYGYVDYNRKNCFYSYNFADTDVMTYNYQEYFNLVKENDYPHPFQFKSAYYWFIIYQNPLYCFLIKDRYREKFISSEWFKEYCKYESENK